MENPHEIGTVKPLTDEAYMIVTALQTTEGEPLVGPVARGGCMVAGEMACKSVCQLWALEHGTANEETAELAEAGFIDAHTLREEDPQACADENLAKALDTLGVRPERALIVAVGMSKSANRVGYVDDPDTRQHMAASPHGWFEISAATPYNAVYTKVGDTLPNGEQLELIGMRIGGSSVVADVIRQEDGNVYGLTHLTRTNMPGSNHQDIYDGREQTYRRHVAQDSIDHYGGDPKDMTTHIISAVGRETAQVRFPDAALIESVMPGWAEDGLIINATNPDWRPGMPVDNPITGEYDLLYRDYPTQIGRQVYGAAESLGTGDVRADNVFDPGVSQNGIVHSSADRVRNASEESDTFAGAVSDRDLYAVVLKSLPVHR